MSTPLLRLHRSPSLFPLESRLRSTTRDACDRSRSRAKEERHSEGADGGAEGQALHGGDATLFFGSRFGIVSFNPGFQVLFSTSRARFLGIRHTRAALNASALALRPLLSSYRQHREVERDEATTPVRASKGGEEVAAVEFRQKHPPSETKEEEKPRTSTGSDGGVSASFSLSPSLSLSVAPPQIPRTCLPLGPSTVSTGPTRSPWFFGGRPRLPLGLCSPPSNSSSSPRPSSS